jgi:hypothetical protein
MALKVTCKRCRNTALAGSTAEADIVRIPGCRCCLENHDHGHFANMTGKPCRPVHIEAPAGFQTVTASGLLLG